jgi:PTH1 family peptidyl-tRNA hydrolase
MESSMRVIVGLGNPGFEYEETRHNLGFMVLDSLCRRMDGLKLRETATHSVYAEVQWRGIPLVLAKPTTFMNHSGFAVREILNRFDTSPGEILVVCDDLALPVGFVRIRARGGSGGHKGMESIIQEIGTGDFPRLRIGIGPPDGDTVDYVLSEFFPDETEAVKNSIEQAAEVALCFLTDGTEIAMQRFNRRVPQTPDCE